MTVLNLSLNTGPSTTNSSTQRSIVLDTGRPLTGGVFHGNFGTLVTGLVNLANGQVPFTTATVANGGTVALTSTQVINILRPTSDGTIAGAIINLPTVGPTGSGALVDGQFVSLSTTGAITAVTGTINGAAVLPAVTTLTAGQVVKLRYNLAATTWFRV